MPRCAFPIIRHRPASRAIRFPVLPSLAGVPAGSRAKPLPRRKAGYVSVGAAWAALLAVLLVPAGPAAARNAADPPGAPVGEANDTASARSDAGTLPHESLTAAEGARADAYAPDSIGRDTLPEVGSIPPEETRELQRRREAKKFSAAGFGPAGFGNVDEHVPAYDVYLGRFWEVNRYAAIKALGEVATDFDRATLANLTLGANLYTTPTDFAPYLGAGMGVGYGARPGDRDFGFNLGAQIGALLFRTSDAQMNLEGSASMIVSEVGDGAPTIYAARLGVLF